MSAERRLLTVGFGVNEYADAPDAALRGCVADGANVRQALGARGWTGLGPVFANGEVTRERVLEVLRSACAALEPGDWLFVQWSSHGTLVEDEREADGYVEAICPHDALVGWPRNLITVYDVAEVARTVAEGARFVLLVDACHSGVKVDDAPAYAVERGLAPRCGPRGPRFLPPPGGVAARPTVRRFSARPVEVEAPWTRTVLWSGCGSDETSADTYEDGQYQGAATWALLRALGELPGGTLSALHEAAARVLYRGGYRQHPSLVGSAGLRGLVLP